MSGSNKYRIERSANFERSLDKLIKAYYRKDSKARDEFARLLGLIIEALQRTPDINGSDPEPWPNGFQLAGYRFRKFAFHLPGLARGKDAHQGRLMYLVDYTACVVKPFWIYTHLDYSTRPPDKHILFEMENAAKGK